MLHEMKTCLMILGAIVGFFLTCAVITILAMVINGKVEI